jgi:hypothetical protein
MWSITTIMSRTPLLRRNQWMRESSVGKRIKRDSATILRDFEGIPAKQSGDFGQSVEGEMLSFYRQIDNARAGFFQSVLCGERG